MIKLKNKVSIFGTKEKTVVTCNGERIITINHIGSNSMIESFKATKEVVEDLKWGVFEKKEIQKHFDSVLNK